MTLAGAILRITHLDITDPAVVEAAQALLSDQGSGSLPGFAASAISLGARALHSARTGHESDTMRRAVTDLEERLERMTDQATSHVRATLQLVTDDKDGSLARGIRQQVDALRAELDHLLAHENGPVRAAADKFLNGVATELRTSAAADTARLTAALSLEDPASPFARLRAEMRQGAEQSRRDVAAALTDIRVALETDRARSAAAEHTAAKGLVYEDEVCAQLDTVTHGLGDQFEATGTSVGLIADCKTGDGLATVAERTAPGRAVKIVIEAKDTTMSAAKWAAELDRARTNRGAVAALAVVNGREHMPGRRAVHIIDPLRVVVCHAAGDKPDLLLAAYHLLRVQAVRAASAGTDTDLDTPALRRQLEEALGALEGFDALDRAASQTTKAAASVTAHAERLRRTVTAHITKATALLDGHTHPTQGT